MFGAPRLFSYHSPFNEREGPPTSRQRKAVGLRTGVVPVTPPADGKGNKVYGEEGCRGKRKVPPPPADYQREGGWDIGAS